MGVIANLIVSMSAKTDQFERDIKRANQQLGFLQKQAKESQAAMQHLAGGFTTLGRSMMGLAAGAGLSFGLSTILKQMMDFERSQFRIQALLKTTGHASGQTAESIERMAQAIGFETLASTAGVREAAAQLLTFRNISGDIFERTLRAAQDLASLGFGSLSSATVQLGKALEDPIKGLSSLREVGVSFSQAQITVIKRLVETGRQAEAMGKILEVLEGQVGGAGKAEARGLAGAFDSLKQSIENFFESLVRDTSVLENLGGILERIFKFMLWISPGKPISEAQRTVANQLRENERLIEQLEARRRGIESRLRKGLRPAEYREQLTQLDIELQERWKRRNVLLRYMEAFDPERKLQAPAPLKPPPPPDPRLLKDRLDTMRLLGDIEAKRRDEIESIITSLSREAAALGKSTTAMQLYTLATLGAGEGARRLARFLADKIQRFQDLQDMIEETAAAEAILLEGLGEATRKGLVATEDEARAAIERLRPIYDRVMAMYESRTLDFFTSLTEQAWRLSLVLSDALIDIAATGELNWRRLGDTISRELLRITWEATGARQALEQLFKQGIEAISEQVGPGSGFSFGSLLGSLFGGGGGTTTMNPNAMPLQHGGPVWPGRAYLVGEHGPELFVSRQAGAIVPHETLRQSAGPQVVINVQTPDAASFRASQDQIASQALRALARAQRRTV